ncbi:hypothetical protein ISN44_As06g034000 [Arabidopsis suecica]|uniref:TPX2 C-terminal domain-containing protein n=1 Tax=Arabidopsis suecica TaxID=45249 RepID=A0A8T2CI80_ARASU|nr:hypothetical protein ISN44_As06g034000 [Arabidopsis suecica]
MMLREGTPFESKILGASLFPCFYVFRCLSLESGDVKNHIVTIEVFVLRIPCSVRNDSLDAHLPLSNSSYAFIANTGEAYELKMLRRSLNFKATSMPTFYQEPQPT